MFVIKLGDAQKALPKIKCGGRVLKNVYVFKYLGSMFSADGDHMVDVKRRVDLAMARMDQLIHIFDSVIEFKLNMKIYKTAVC